jgi:hypothetical protein
VFNGDEGTRDSEFSVCQTLSFLRLTSVEVCSLQGMVLAIMRTARMDKSLLIWKGPWPVAV